MTRLTIWSIVHGLMAFVFLLAMVLRAPAQTDWTDHARTAIQSHLAVCGPAMADAADFIANLSTRFPAGTFDTNSTPDGQIFRATISTEAGRFHTMYTRYLFAEIGQEHCATYMQNQDFVGVVDPAVANGFRNAALEFLAPEAVIGGPIAEVSSGYDQGTDILSQRGELYEFALNGLVGGPEVISFSHAIAGHISIVSARELRRPPELAPRITHPAAFADHCFSPFLTAALAEAHLPARHDFYDLDPFSAANSVSPAIARAVTPGTDRRCEVVFDGDDVGAGIAGVLQGLSQEGIDTEAEVPADFPAQDGTEFIAARQLNPNRIAVVQVGTRSGPNGIETFINVERLVPLDEE